MSRLLSVEGNKNYAATVVKVAGTYDLPGLDNLVGVSVFGSQVLTQRNDTKAGDLRIYFPAESQLSHELAKYNNLYRDASLNVDPSETGFFEVNRRVKAIKFRGNRSDALLLPLEAFSYLAMVPSDFKEGDTFDTIAGVEVVRKYEVKRTVQRDPQVKKLVKAFKRVTDTQFPMHLDTDNFWRNSHLLDGNREVIVTQKLHGTSLRVGRVHVRRQKGRFERALNRVGVSTPVTELANVYGSRKVIKDANNPNQNHFYGSDVWTAEGKKLDGLIPDGYVVYGELIGWTTNSEGDVVPIQRGYTYDVPKGEAELYVYRVATVNASGVMADLSWDGVRQFCAARGLKHVPEIDRLSDGIDVTDIVDALMDLRYADTDVKFGGFNWYRDPMVPLSDAKTVDEGICLRQDKIVPLILKAKSPAFLQHETKLLDKGEADLESVG